MTTIGRVSERETTLIVGDRQADTAPSLANSIRLQILKKGKDRLAEHDLDQVRAARADVAISPEIAGFYHCVLDKTENRYSYQSYLAMDVLKPLLPTQGRIQNGRDLVSHLLHDLSEFERMTLDNGGGDLLPHGRPSRQVALKRIRKAGDLRESANPLEEAIDSMIEPVESILHFSVLPVSDQHDEYLFIRVLQCYETIFTMMAILLEEAVMATESGDVSDVTSRVESAATTLDRASGLFSLLATMPPANFRSFRLQTDGSSAIQSEAYKLVEIFCALPRKSRIDSPAFLSVPTVRQRASSDHDSLASWYCRQWTRWSDAESRMMTEALERLETSHQKWKRTHYSIAKSMIGSSGGTGGTEGIEYLRKRMEARLFWPIGEQCPHRGLVPKMRKQSH
ncbi:hypothetical protein AB0E55_14195 [Amycolatopsis keratiniphila]|uniref:hypothetical protein n=1 Tax=Amycolatopsis keratiniphila TaxID=129921 RepID=UPI0033F5E0FC